MRASRWELSRWAQGDPKQMASECGQWPQEPRKKTREPSVDCIGAFTCDFESGS
jgi:hypothetical protein